MDPAAAPFAGQVAQWGAVGVLVAFQFAIIWALWRSLQGIRAAWDTARDSREREDRADRKDQTAADMALAQALNALRDVIMGRAAK